MTLEIVSIGDELLSGFTINSNAAEIAQRLLPNGITVERVTSLADDLESLKVGIQEAMKRSSFVITTGGLGPTGDDRTRAALADIFGVPLEYNETVAQDLNRRYQSKLSTLEDQATIPKGSIPLLNPIGTAPGFIMTHSSSTVIVLPGVPSQMAALLDQVIPYLEERVPKSHYMKTLYFCLLSEQTVDPLLRTLEEEHPGVQIGICPGYGVLSIFIRAHKKELLDPIAAQIIQPFKSYFFSESSKEIERALHQWMVRNKQTLASAESCTGGHLSARLTALSGASDYFLGGVVSYSNALKSKALEVSSSTLKSYGAVSEEVVAQMAKGTLKLTGAHYVLAVSGVAGPLGGSKEKPVGTVWGAVLTPEQLFTGKIPIRGSLTRELVIDYSTTFLLSSLWRYLNHQTPPFS